MWSIIALKFSSLSDEYTERDNSEPKHDSKPKTEPESNTETKPVSKPEKSRPRVGPASKVKRKLSESDDEKNINTTNDVEYKHGKSGKGEVKIKNKEDTVKNKEDTVKNKESTVKKKPKMGPASKVKRSRSPSVEDINERKKKHKSDQERHEKSSARKEETAKKKRNESDRKKNENTGESSDDEERNRREAEKAKKNWEKEKMENKGKYSL